MQSFLRGFCADFHVRLFVRILDFLCADFRAGFDADFFFQGFVGQGDHRESSKKNPSKKPPPNPPRIPPTAPRIFASQPSLRLEKSRVHTLVPVEALAQLLSVPLSDNIGQWLMQV